MEFRQWLLNEEKIKVGIKDLEQQTDFTCGATALQAIMHSYGIKKSEKEMKQLLKSDPKDGTETESLIKVARDHGFKTSVKHNMDISDLEQWLDEDKPVIVVLQLKGTDYDKLNNGHYMVLIGNDEKFLYFMDPASKRGVRGKISKSEFLKRWKDEDRYRWGMAVYKDEKPREYPVRKVKRV